MFSGPGGHASAPHLTGSPIEAVADFVTGLAVATEEVNTGEDVVAR